MTKSSNNSRVSDRNYDRNSSVSDREDRNSRVSDRGDPKRVFDRSDHDRVSDRHDNHNSRVSDQDHERNSCGSAREVSHSSRGSTRENSLKSRSSERDDSHRTYLGLDGKDRRRSSAVSKIFVSNLKAFLLTAETHISRATILKFQSQILQKDFDQTLEDLIDPIVIKQLVLASKAKLNVLCGYVRREQLDDLRNHFVDTSNRKQLDREVWNNDTVIKLLLDNFPKDDRAYDLFYASPTSTCDLIFVTLT